MRPPRQLIKVLVAILALLSVGACRPVESSSRGAPGRSHPSTSTEKGKGTGSTTTARAVVRITASDDVCWTGQLGRRSKRGCGSATVQVQDTNGTYTIYIVQTKGNGSLNVILTVNGRNVQRYSASGTSSIVSIDYATG